MAREPHAAHGGVKQLGVLGAIALEHAAVAHAQLERAHVASERAGHVVVFAMDVRGDHAAQGHVSGAGRHRREEAAREKDAVELAERETGLRA